MEKGRLRPLPQTPSSGLPFAEVCLCPSLNKLASCARPGVPSSHLEKELGLPVLTTAASLGRTLPRCYVAVWQSYGSAGPWAHSCRGRRSGGWPLGPPQDPTWLTSVLAGMCFSSGAVASAKLPGDSRTLPTAAGLLPIPYQLLAGTSWVGPTLRCLSSHNLTACVLSPAGDLILAWEDK